MSETRNSWWEYLVLHTARNEQEQQDILNMKGSEGWELVGVSHEDRRLYLKRHRINVRPKKV